MSDEETYPPWDIKKHTLYLGGEDDENGSITFIVFNDAGLDIQEGDGDQPPLWAYEDIDLSAARRLRDFLNFALIESERRGDL